MKENIAACVRTRTEDAKNLENIASQDVEVTTIMGVMVERTTALKIEVVGRLAVQIPCTNHIERDDTKVVSIEKDAIATETGNVTTVTESHTMVGTSTIPIRLYCYLYAFLI